MSLFKKAKILRFAFDIKNEFISKNPMNCFYINNHDYKVSQPIMQLLEINRTLAARASCLSIARACWCPLLSPFGTRTRTIGSASVVQSTRRRGSAPAVVMPVDRVVCHEETPSATSPEGLHPEASGGLSAASHCASDFPAISPQSIAFGSVAP